MKKHLLIAVTGSISVYKALDLVSQLSKIEEYDVEVMMSKAACEFIQPLSFESLIHRKVHLDPFTSPTGEVMHIKLATWADLIVMVPASANTIAKVTYGICDNILTDTWLASKALKMICPAMNTLMYDNEVTQQNIQTLKKRGVIVVEPEFGHLACGTEGKGKLAKVDDILEAIASALSEHPLAGKKVLINAGPTQEAIDPVRYITNHSSGKMGYALARQAKRLGAKVTLVSGKTSLPQPHVDQFIQVTSAGEMARHILGMMENYDYIILSAAIADYTPTVVANHKIKKNEGTMQLTLGKTVDILETVGQKKQPHQMLCGFCMETEDLIKNAVSKLQRKHCDLMVANNLVEKGAGFQTDTNVVTLITDFAIDALPLLSKDEVAKAILLRLYEMENQK